MVIIQEGHVSIAGGLAAGASVCSALAPQPGQRQAVLGAGTSGTAASTVAEDDRLLRSIAQTQLHHWQGQAPQLAGAGRGSAQAGTWVGTRGSRQWSGVGREGVGESHGVLGSLLSCAFQVPMSVAGSGESVPSTTGAPGVLGFPPRPSCRDRSSREPSRTLPVAIVTNRF